MVSIFSVKVRHKTRGKNDMDYLQPMKPETQSADPGEMNERAVAARFQEEVSPSITVNRYVFQSLQKKIDFNHKDGVDLSELSLAVRSGSLSTLENGMATALLRHSQAAKYLSPDLFVRRGVTDEDVSLFDRVKQNGHSAYLTGHYLGSGVAFGFAGAMTGFGAAAICGVGRNTVLKSMGGGFGVGLAFGLGLAHYQYMQHKDRVDQFLADW
jgi:hypothetical protein